MLSHQRSAIDFTIFFNVTLDFLPKITIQIIAVMVGATKTTIISKHNEKSVIKIIFLQYNLPLVLNPH